ASGESGKQKGPTKAAVIRGRSRPILQHASVAPFPAEARDAEAATNHVKQKRWHERAREMGRAASIAQLGRAQLRPGLELAVQRKGISRCADHSRRVKSG